MNKALYQQIGKRIRTARQQAGMTQAELAEFSGYGSYISILGWEKGNNKVPVEALYRMAQVLGVKVQELLPPEEENEA